MKTLSDGIINLHFGQAGIQMGSAIWELLCHEHRIDPEGNIDKLSRDPADTSHESFFRSSASKSTLTPRAILADLEPNTIDEIRNGLYRNLFDTGDLQNSVDGASNNFAKGFFYNSDNIRQRVEDRITSNLEMCDRCHAIMIYRSLGGGTGTGFSNAMFEFLSNYPKLTRMDYPIYPSSKLTTSVLEPYNAILDIHFSMEDIDLSFMFDNEALYNICLNLIEVKKPNYNNLNRVIAQVVSSITASTRYSSVLTNGITVMSTNLIPYPRIHYPLLTYSPLENTNKANFEQSSLLEITENLFLPDSQLITCDPSKGKYLSCSCLYRGNVCIPEIYRSLAVVKTKSNVQFVDWCPTGFKIGITKEPPVQVKGSFIGSSTKQVIMVANTSSIGQVMERVLKKFYFLFAKRSYVHWYVGEGIEECEFMDGFYNISSLISDYEEICTDSLTDISYVPNFKENPFTNQGNSNNEGRPNKWEDEDDIDFTEFSEDYFTNNNRNKIFWTSSEEQFSFDKITPINSDQSYGVDVLPTDFDDDRSEWSCS